jgi:IS5 family transposase
VPRNHNGKEESEAIKAGEVPEDWKDKPLKLRQKDVDARWTKKNGMSHFGYKNHVNVDRKHKLVRSWHVTDAAAHDSQAVDKLLSRTNTARDVWAGHHRCAIGPSDDGDAYRSAEIEAKLKTAGLRSRIHRKGRRNHPLGERAKQGNRTKSSVRVRVEHVFGAQANDLGGVIVRTIGLARAKVKIGLKNLTYNMRRLGQLRRLHPAPV